MCEFYRLDGKEYYLSGGKLCREVDGTTECVVIDRWDNGLPKCGSEYGIPWNRRGVAYGAARATKPSNPKDAVGSSKVSMSVLPANVLMEVALGMHEGALKYGRHNYRAVGVRTSVYYDATMRHLMAFWEGEDIDPDSKLSHITKAISSLVVLRDSMLRQNCVDDRPPKTNDGWMVALNERAAELQKLHSNSAVKHYFEKEQ